MEVRPAERPRACTAKQVNFRKNCCVCKGKRYTQPPRPKSFAPVSTYQKPKQPIECATIYRKSYIPSQAPRPDPIRPSDNICGNKSSFAKDTIHRMSYPGWGGVRPSEAIVPCAHLGSNEGPMQEITTHRHDFVPKPLSRPEQFVPSNNIFSSNQQISDKTINRLSYQPVSSFEKVEPVIPRGQLERPQGEISCSTIQNMSYRPMPLPGKEDLPWARKIGYEGPKVPMSCDTIYNKSYLPCGVVKTEAIVPVDQANPLACPGRFDDKTVFKMSYLPVQADRPEQIVPKNNLEVSRQKMEGSTIQKLSYLPNYGFKPPLPTAACDHDLSNKGPMQEITTTRHDYVPKPIYKTEPCNPENTIARSTEPLSNKTINRLSYLPVVTFDVVKPTIPTQTLELPKGPMECRTIQKMSYRPIDSQEKVALPWARRDIYQAPTSRMACETVYNMSYDAPGDIYDDCLCVCGGDSPCPPSCPIVA